jgi:hypothetical protein
MAWRFSDTDFVPDLDLHVHQYALSGSVACGVAELVVHAVLLRLSDSIGFGDLEAAALLTLQPG